MNRRSVITILLLLAGCAPSAADEAEKLDGELKAALSDAEGRLKSDPDDLRGLSDRGDALFFLGRFDEAVRDYDRMIALDPSFGPTHWQRGLALYFAGRYDDAAKQFERSYNERDKSDRENGIWRFYSQVKKDGVEAARKALLPYTEPDRPPLPTIYRLCADEAKPEDVSASAGAPNLPEPERPKRRFYADLYLGLDAAIVRNDPAAARPFLEKAMENPWPRESGYGANFMWHIARLSLGRLDKKP